MNAAVTGGTGFLGEVLVRLLVTQAQTVSVLVRHPRDDERLRSLGAHPVRGDLTLAGGCDGLIVPGDTVFHAAAHVDMNARWPDLRRITIDGTQRLLQAALPLKPRRFVYVSSGGVYALKPGPTASPVVGPARYDLYSQAKLAAEELVRTECDRAGCPWAVLRLGVLYGPGNHPLIRHMAPLVQHGYLFLIGGGENRIATLYVDDAARAVLLAGTHPAAEGKIFDVASDERVTQREYMNAIADALALPPIRRCIPLPLAHLGAWAETLLAKLKGSTPLFNRAIVALMGADQVLDAGRIRQELGWRPQMLFQNGMQRMKEWYCQLRAEDRIPSSCVRDSKTGPRKA